MNRKNERKQEVERNVGRKEGMEDWREVATERGRKDG